MGEMTIRDMDDALLLRLRERALASGQSLEDLARGILASAATDGVPLVGTPDERLARVDRIRAMSLRPPARESWELIREDRDFR